jgi:hypothetical protein
VIDVTLCPLQDQIPQVVEKAAASEGNTAEAQRRAAAFGRALDLHLSRLRQAPMLAVSLFTMSFQVVCTRSSGANSHLLILQEQAGRLRTAGPC